MKKIILLIGIVMISIVGCTPLYSEKYDENDPMAKDIINEYGLMDYCKWLINIKNDYPNYIGCIDVEVDTTNKICNCIKNGEK